VTSILVITPCAQNTVNSYGPHQRHNQTPTTPPRTHSTHRTHNTHSTHTLTNTRMKTDMSQNTTEVGALPVISGGTADLCPVSCPHSCSLSLGCVAHTPQDV
jgi:hypothetical protein